MAYLCLVGNEPIFLREMLLSWFIEFSGLHSSSLRKYLSRISGYCDHAYLHGLFVLAWIIGGLQRGCWLAKQEEQENVFRMMQAFHDFCNRWIALQSEFWHIHIIHWVFIFTLFYFYFSTLLLFLLSLSHVPLLSVICTYFNRNLAFLRNETNIFLRFSYLGTKVAASNHDET